MNRVCLIGRLVRDPELKKTTSGACLVGVDGRLNQRSYMSKDNRNVNVIEIIAEQVQFLEKKGSDNSSSFVDEIPQDSPESDDIANGIDASDDQLPF